MSYNSWKLNKYYLEALKVAHTDGATVEDLIDISNNLVFDAIDNDKLESEEVWMARDAINTLMELTEPVDFTAPVRGKHH